MDTGLKGRRAIVTGGANGIGAAISAALATEGCAVWIADRDEPAAARAAATLSAEGWNAKALRLDVSKAEAVSSAFAEEFGGGLDILVCNAGLISTGTFLECDDAEWRRVFDVNLFGVVNCARAAARAMEARGGGRIVNVASISAERGGGSIGNVVYGASKAAVVALTKGLAREFGPSGVTVNAIAPAVADTDMTRATLQQDVRRRIVERIPLHRLATPQDIADAVVFLASTRASFINGAVLAVDGGILTT